MQRLGLAHWFVVSILINCFSGGIAFAQQPEPQKGFAIDRFDPAEHGSDWFTVESLDLRGNPRIGLGLVLDWGYKPLVLYREDGSELKTIIEDQLFAHVGGGIIFLDRIRLALNLPVALFQDGKGGATTEGIGGETFKSSNATTVGNLRIGADVRIAGEYRDPISFAIGLQVHAPTGSQDAYTSDGSTRLVPRLMIAGRLSKFEYGARLGMNVRTKDIQFENKKLGSEINFGVSAGVRIANGKLLLGPELFGSTVVTDKNSFFKRKTTPLELLLGLHYLFHPDWKTGLGASFGLTPGYGSPAVRVVGSIAWLPEPEKPVEPPKDRDHDGIFDHDDACPDEPGPASSDPTKNGCPVPLDTDGDGIIDKEDACPTEPGIPTDDPTTNGCPAPSDRDGDGIIDEKDACPDEPGVATNDPETNGCPPPRDRDGDGIIDKEDACPDDPGPRNSDPSKNGCPRAVITATQIRILEKVNFATAKAVILESSYPVLSEVVSILKEHEEVTKLSVEGHTDNRGSSKYNKTLSQKRANSVMKYLVDNGISASRLVAKGYGFERPIATNDTEEGRAENRRVEFNILEQNGDSIVSSKRSE
jgi:OmpA-OmpF porin, OOP family